MPGDEAELLGHLEPVLGMTLERLPLLLGQPAGLREDVGRHHQLADVVEQAAEPDGVDHLGGQAVVSGQLDAVGGHAAAVRRDGGAPGLERGENRVDVADQRDGHLGVPLGHDDHGKRLHHDISAVTGKDSSRNSRRGVEPASMVARGVGIRLGHRLRRPRQTDCTCAMIGVSRRADRPGRRLYRGEDTRGQSRIRTEGAPPERGPPGKEPPVPFEAPHRAQDDPHRRRGQGRRDGQGPAGRDRRRSSTRWRARASSTTTPPPATSRGSS